jgi:metal-sulfur cluster biosynthetic enzyme
MNTAIGEEMLADLEAMRDVVDPELGINVVDLGLVYGIDVEKGETGTVALIDMTLTSAACPLTDVIEDQTVTALVGAGLVNEIKINWVWNPPCGAGQDHRGRPRATARPRVHRLGHWLARAHLRYRRQGVLEVLLGHRDLAAERMVHLQQQEDHQAHHGGHQADRQRVHSPRCT